jgi:ABC-type antimicrobial peptide transport system permease subunit
MNPLSPLTYYLRHKWSALLLTSLITLTTLGLYVMIAVLDSLTLMNAEISYLKHVSRVTPNIDPLFEPGVVSKLQSHPDIDRVIPENGLSNGLSIVQPALSNPYHVPLLGIRQDDLQYLIDHCRLRIKEGRLLKPRTNEIMLSEEVARALGLQPGDQIAQSIDPEAYYLIRSPMVLVGILEQVPWAGSPRQGSGQAGPSTRMGLASYEYLDSHELYAPQIISMLVVAQEGREQAVNEFLEAEIASSRTEVDTYEREYRLWAQDRQEVLFAFGLINCIVAIGAAAVVGAINRIAITQRLPELGLLSALGHHKKRLIRRLALETAAVSGLSWLTGLVLAFIVLAWMKINLYYDKGMELDLLNPTPFLFVVPIPLTVIVLSTMGIIRVFIRFDAVAIVERGKLSLEAQTRQRSAKRSLKSPSHPGALSAFTFYLRHRSRGVTLLISTVLAILVITGPIFIASATADVIKPDLEYLHHVSEVWPEGKRVIDAGVMAQIKSHPAVERVIPTMSLPLQVAIPLGDRVTTGVYGIPENDLPYLLDLFGMRIQEGRLPRVRSNEIVLAASVALNHGLRVGDTIELPYLIIHQIEQLISYNDPVEMVIVGILERQTERSAAGGTPADGMWLSFASYEFMANHESTSSRSVHLLVVPTEGHKAELDAWLEQNISSAQTHVSTYEIRYSEMTEMMRNLILIFGATEIGITVIAAIAVAVMNYISFTQRREEFGILNALGRNRLWLVLRTAKETGSVVAVAWLISAVIYGAGLIYVQSAIYAPKGMSLNLFNPRPWFFTFPIPLAVVLSSAGTIAWALTKLDPVAVVEKRT